jgi:hypothetical protein
LRASASPIGKDNDLLFTDIGQGVDRHMLYGIPASQSDRDASKDYEKRIPQTP